MNKVLNSRNLLRSQNSNLTHWHFERSSLFFFSTDKENSYQFILKSCSLTLKINVLITLRLENPLSKLTLTKRNDARVNDF